MQLGSITRQNFRHYYRAAIFFSWGIVLFSVFWFFSRYPSLLNKAHHVGHSLDSMAFERALLPVSDHFSFLTNMLRTSVSWLGAMSIGMTFGVLLGAFLHTLFEYYPLRFGKNIYWNSLKGALIGAPMGVCVNCAVPIVCGTLRAKGRTETALSYLFSSPSFNPIVILMTFSAFPPLFAIIKYIVLSLVILLLVPLLVSVQLFEKNGDVSIKNVPCERFFRNMDCSEHFLDVLGELAKAYFENIIKLLKPTLVIMLVASLVAALSMMLIPWPVIFSEITWVRAAIVSFFSVLMPVPIALDVMFAAHLYQSGIAPGYAVIFLMTLGTYSMVPAIYLWREVSKWMSISLFFVFWFIGFVCALFF